MKKINKNNVNILFGLLLTLFTASSCGYILDDVQDLKNYPSKGTFDDEQLTNAYVASLYRNTLPSWPINYGDWADESGSIISPDWITISNDRMKPWPYSTIRNINILLKEVPIGKISESKKLKLIAQAKFLRAYNYFEMLYHYGGIPIIKVPQELGDDLNISRNSTKECFEFIIEDLDNATSNVNDKSTGSDFGRIDKAAVLSFKGRVLLYKASPQFNPSAPYSNKYWKDAYAANKEAKEFLDSNGYGLVGNYVDVFETEQHKENILSISFKDPIRSNGRIEHGVRPLSESKNHTGVDQPTWELAKAYPMKDGKIPGTSTKYSYDVQTYWKNRDPRFVANLVWNGAIYELSGKIGRRQYTMTNIAASVDAFGYNIQGEKFNRSGLYCRKGVKEENPSTLVETNDFDWLEIRYAEVLFNYAESANETGHQDEALQVLKDIRKRAGIENGVGNMYGLKTSMNRDEMREAILHEKFIEMAFEGKRFWDLRRHRMLNRINGMRKHGIMAIEVNGKTYDKVTSKDEEKAKNYGFLPEDFKYKVVELITGTGSKEMSMPDKYYFFPIKLQHIDVNPNLKQNLGWGGTFNPTM